MFNSQFFDPQPDIQDMIDLHGLSIEKAKRVVIHELVTASQLNQQKIRFVTGRGNHVNSRGQRGTLYRYFPQWIEEANLSQRIEKTEKFDGFYEIHFKSTATPRPINVMVKQIADEVLKQKFADIKTSAEEGNAYFQWIYGSMLERGRYAKQNHKLAFQFYLRAARQNYPHAMHDLARCYTHGIGTRLNDKEAFAWLVKADQLDYSPCTLMLGDCHWFGRGTNQNDALAVKYYQKAAHLGDATAKRKLAFAYCEGLGVEKDIRLAAKLYKEAADAGNAMAQYNIAAMLEEGLGIDRNEKLAWHYMQLAAENGDPDAQFVVGIRFWEGEKVTCNKTKGMQWLERAANNNSLQANRFLSQIAESSVQRQQYLTRAAQIGDLKSTLLLQMQEEEKEQKRNPGALLKTLKDSAERLSNNEIMLLEPGAQFLLLDYMISTKKPAFCEQALHLYKKLADHNVYLALRRLFFIYMNALNVKQDISKALGYLKRAVELKDSKSIVLLGYFHEQGLYEIPLSQELAISLYQQAAALNNPTAHFNLALKLLEQIKQGRNISVSKVYEYLIKAIELEKNKIILADLSTGYLDKYNPITPRATEIAKALLTCMGQEVSEQESLPATMIAGSTARSFPKFITNSFSTDAEQSLEYKQQGKLEYERKDYARARVLFSLAIQKNNNLKEAWFNRGLCQIQLKQNEMALKDFSEAIKRDPTYTKAVYQYIKLLLDMRRGQEALHIIEQYQSYGGAEKIILNLRAECAQVLEESVSRDNIDENLQTHHFQLADNQEKKILANMIPEHVGRFSLFNTINSTTEVTNNVVSFSSEISEALAQNTSEINDKWEKNTSDDEIDIIYRNRRCLIL